MKQAQVQLLARSDLDLRRWDKTIRRAPYGLSWWLDAVTGGNWYGIVLDDYRAVMPLPISRSLGPFKFINGAPFTQHQGPFGDYDDEDFRLLLGAIPRHWYVRKLSFYPPLVNQEVFGTRLLTSRTNYELSLEPEYKQLQRGYRGNLRRELRDFPLLAMDKWPLPEFLTFYRQYAGEKSGLNERQFSILSQLTMLILRHKKGNCYRATDEDGSTISAVLIVHHGNRLINLLAASTPRGLELHGMPRLLDSLIWHHSGMDFVLDFEGSDIPGVAMFFRGFGAKRVGYWSVGSSVF